AEDGIRDLIVTGVQTCALPIYTDNCPDDPGEDPIENIMGYSAQCRGEFSPGQIKRMTFLYRTVRGGKGDDDATPVEPTTPDSGRSEERRVGKEWRSGWSKER